MLVRSFSKSIKFSSHASFAARNAIIAPRVGTGGRSSNNSNLTVTVFGAYGFIGRYLVDELGSCGTRTYIPFRGDELEIRHLKPMFDLGQLGLLPFSPRDPDSIREAMKSSDIVINMIGKHYETKNILPTKRADGKYSRVNFSFDEVHARIPADIAKIAKEVGVKGFVHVSALNATQSSGSKWARSKAEGEKLVLEAFPEAVVVKLSTVFGPEDRFLNWIAEATNRLPAMPLIEKGRNLVQPVYAADVGKGLMEIIKNYDELAGKTFQFVGPAEYSYKEIAEFVQDVTFMRKQLVDIPDSLAILTGRVVNELVAPVWTEDMAYQATEDIIKINDPSLGTLQDLGIEPASMDHLAFDYLHRFRKGGHFTLVKGYH